MSQTFAQLINGKSATVEFSTGSASTPSVAFSSDTNTGIYSPGADQVAISTGGSGRLFITNGGNVGVGVSSPQGKLTVSNSGAEGIEFNPGYASGLSSILAYNRTTSAHTELGFEATQFPFRISGTERMRLDSSGRLGVGTSSVSRTLDVVSTDTWIRTARTGGNAWIVGTGVQDAYRIYDDTAGAERFRIDTSGRVGIGTTTPQNLFVISNGGANGLEFNPTTESGTANYVISYNRTAAAYRDLRFDTAATRFEIGGNEAARIDSSRRLLVGTSTNRNNLKTQVEGTTSETASLSVFRNSNDANPAILVLGKSRGTSVNSKTVVSSGDRLGIIAFHGSDGTQDVEGAYIETFVDGTPGANDMPSRLVFSTTADGASSPTERMRIDNSGNIGFGNNINLGNLPGGGTNNATGVAVDSGVLKACRSNYTMQVGVSSAGTGLQLMQIFQNGTNCGAITVSNSNATAFVTSSDYRLKENISPIKDARARFSLLKPSSFNFKNNPGVLIDGFIAHEVQEVVPEAITGEKDAVDDDGNPIYQGIDQSKLVPLLTAALQEAIGEIESLKARLTAAGI